MLKTLPYPWTPRDARGAKIALWASHTDALRQEEFGDGATNYVGTAAAYGEPVGTAFLCQEGHVLTALSSAYRPTLEFDSSAGRNNFFRFGAASQPSSLILQNSKGALRNIHCTQVYTICLWLRMGTGGSVGGDGTIQTILDCNNETNSAAGWYLQRYSDNTLQFYSSDGASHWQCTGALSPGTLKVANGWVPIVIQATGAGTNTGTLAIGGSVTGGVFVPTVVATFNLSHAAAIGTDAGYNLTIGSNESNGHHSQIDLDSLVITDGLMDASDLTNWYNFNPAQNAGTLARVAGGVSASSEIEPADLSHLFGDWDFTRPTHPVNDQAMLFQDAAASTPITAGNQTLEYAENWLGKHLKRWLYFDSAAYAAGWTAPTWQIGNASQANPFPLPACFFNGSGSGSTSTPNVLSFNQQLPPGDKTIILVMQQNNNGPSGGADTGLVGSHLLNYSGAVEYIAIGGSYHSSPSTLAVHPTGPSATSFYGVLAPTVTALTVTGSTTPYQVAGTYTLVTPTLADQENGVYYYFCAAANGGAGAYLWWGSNNWVISSTVGGSPAASWVSPHQYQVATYAAEGTATGTPAVAIPTGGGNTSIGVNLYHFQQKGGLIRAGVNGLWCPWMGDSGGNPIAGVSMAYDTIGNDAHYNGGATPSDTQHFELNAFVTRIVAYNYAHRDYFLNKVLRRLGNRFGIQGMTLIA